MTALLTPVLEKLKDDQDVDVRYFANEAITGKCSLQSEVRLRN